MSKDRILGSSVTIELYTPATGVMSIEVDSFSKSQKHDIKSRTPLGSVGEQYQVIYKGWDLDFKLGKVDDRVESFFQTMDEAMLNGQAAPRVRVVETIKHFDGSHEVWSYPDTVLYGYKGDASSAADEIKEEFKGACNRRIRQ